MDDQHYPELRTYVRTIFDGMTLISRAMGHRMTHPFQILVSSCSMREVRCVSVSVTRSPQIYLASCDCGSQPIFVEVS